MPANQRYSSAPRLRKAEREQLNRLFKEGVALLARKTQLVDEHKISDEDLATLHDYAIPFGREIQDPHLRAKWRSEFYDVAPYEGVREATKRAHAEIARYQAQGGLEAEERQKRSRRKSSSSGSPTIAQRVSKRSRGFSRRSRLAKRSAFMP